MAAAKSYVRRLSGGALFFFVLGLSLTHIRDFDTWWHLKTGQLILQSGIVRFDPFSYVLDGRRWITMEWLSQVLFFLLFKWGGAAALTGFKAGILSLAFLILWKLHPERPLWAAVLLAISAWTLQEYFVERPFIFDQLLLCALTAALWNIRFRDPPRHLSWSLPLGTALWANLHGGAAILCPGLTFLAAAAERLRDRGVSLRRWGPIAGISVAAALANPHGAGILTQLWGTLTFPEKDLIREWHAPTHHFMGLYGLFLIAGIGAALKTFKQRPFAAAWTLAAAAASLRMERNIPLYVLLASPVIISAYIPRFFLSPGSAALGVVGLGLGGALWTHDRSHWGVGLEEPLSGAVAFLDEAGIEGRMFNEYETGGYLIWKAAPRRKVFIDGRSLEYGPQAVRQAMAWYQPKVWDALDRRWQFDYALVARHSSGAYTARVLEESPQWQPVYWDDNAMVYLRRTPAHEKLLRRYGYRLLRPGRALAQYLEPLLQEEERGRAVLLELDRSVAQARGSCINAWLQKAYAAARLKSPKEAAAAALEAVKLAPSRAQPRFTLGWVYESAGDFDGAEKEYRLAAGLVAGPERAGIGADILNNLGRMRERKDDLVAARSYYQKSLSWNPAQGDAFRNLNRIR